MKHNGCVYDANGMSSHSRSQNLPTLPNCYLDLFSQISLDPSTRLYLLVPNFHLLLVKTARTLSRSIW